MRPGPDAARAIARVYFVNRFFFPDESATAQLLADLAFGLAAQGFEIHIFCSRQLYGTPSSALPAEESLRGVFIHRLWTTRFGRRRLLGRTIDYASFYASCLWAMSRRLRRGDIVVAKTDPPLISLVAAVAASFRRAILVNWLQDIFPEVASQLGANPLPDGLNGLLCRLRDRSLRAAAVNVVIGHRMARYVSALGVPRSKIRIVENWSPTELAQPKAPIQSILRERLGLGAKFVVGYSGNLGRAHDYETLLGAAEVLGDDAQVVFLMIGGGAKMEEFHAVATARGLHNIQFLPYQQRDTLDDSLAASDVHVVSLIPALEGLIVPSKFYGILAAERPVIFIGDPDGELARIIRETGNGATVQIGRATELAEVVTRLQGSADLREAMGRASRQLLLRSYSADRACNEWSAMLDEIRNLTSGESHPR